ncbi:fibronectin type III domain-containing protein [Flavobacterium sp. C4GT6]|uniref:fibronectin type III domain-containing protein n=1 Tax=Flavobacterium sp. C4GT6 TaxID=3103818 RepID=UPI002ED27CEF
MKRIIILISFLLLKVFMATAQCVVPSNLTVTEITSNSALLSWDAVSTGSEVQFYQASIVVGDNDATDGGTTTSTSMSNYFPLASGTTYTAYIRSFCSGTWSDWSTGTEFTTTACTGAELPYSLDFENVTASLIPECTTSIANSGSGFWTTVTNPGSGFETGTLKFGPSNAAGDSWLFTKGVNLEAGTYYKITFRYGNNSTETAESIMLTYGVSPTAEDAVALYAATIDDAIPHTQDLNFFTVEETGTYYIGFRALSEANQGELYIDDFSLQQTVCGTPENATASALTYNSATISWEAATEGNVPSTGYYFGYSTTNTPPTSPETVTELFQELTALEANTTYYAFIKNECGDVNSEWEVIEFTTPCLTTPLPYTEDFESLTESQIPECTSSVTIDTGNSWTSVSNPGSGFESGTLMYTGNNETANSYFVMAPVEMEANTFYKISFRYGNNSSETTENIRLRFGTSPNPSTWTNTITEITGINNNEEQIYFSAPFTVGDNSGIYYFGIQAYSDANQGNIYIDDIIIDEWTCSIPQNIGITDITSTTATVAWEAAEGGTSMGYFYTFGTSNIPSDEGMVMVNDLSVTFDELEAGTTYYVFVRNFCGPVMGEWPAPLVFTTPCTETATVPYTQDFESATAPEIPNCTSIATNSGSEWATAGNPGNGFDSNTLIYTATEANADAWYFTQGIELTAGTFYKIQYTYGNDSGTTTESLMVTMSTNPNPATASEGGMIGEHTITDATLATQTTNYVTVEEDGIYYFGFHAQSEGAQGSIYVDNFSVEENTCGTPSNLTVSDITESSATFTWEATTEGNTTPSVYQYAIGDNDTPPAEGTYEENFTTDFSELEPETTYYAFVRTQCGPIWSDWEMVEFTTEAELGLNNNTFKGFTYQPNPTEDIVTLSNSTIIDNVEVYNLTGQLVLQQKAGTETTQVEMSSLPSGAYFLTIHAGNELKQIKVLKK